MQVNPIPKRGVRPLPAIFLEAPIEVAVELEKRGWHRGHWQTVQHLDRGVCEAIASINIRAGLESWYKAVLPEAVREGKSCVCLHHPSLHWENVRNLACATFHRIASIDADDATRKLSAIAESLTQISSTGPSRNLIYHIWPKRGNGVWQWNVQQLLPRIEQFDGIRSVAVAAGWETDPVVDVKRAFDGVRIDNWIAAPNNPELGETATFGELLETLPINGSITFRAHAKGARYDDPQRLRDWTEMLYQICLDDPEFVRTIMEQYPAAGPFPVDNRWPSGNRYDWYFSGGFYWFHSEILRKPDWRNIRQDYWGAELWLGQHFARNEVGVLFGQNCGDLYDHQELQRMKTWLDEWKSRRRPQAT